MRTIGFAGTAKNTGKTTAALHLLELSCAAGYRSALTGIGYDGEALDNVTGLPKPRYFVRRGVYVATAESCLKSGSAGYILRQRTGIDTILGPVVIVEVNRPGLVVLAGPNKRADLQRVFSLLEQFGADLTIVDGALNRLVPMVCAGGVVLSTGAAFDDCISRLAAHAAALCELFAPQSKGSPAGSIEVEFAGGGLARLPFGSLIGQATLGSLLAAVQQPVHTLTIPGACLPHLLARFLAERKAFLEGSALVFASPLHLIAGGSSLEWRAVFNDSGIAAGRLRYIETVSLRYVTVNPFYPRYLQRTGAYQPAYVDKARLLSTFRAQIHSTPVFDLRQPPLPDLLSLAGMSPEEP